MKLLDDLISTLDLDALVKDIRQGANFRQIKGTAKLTMTRS